jgi:hypothetical protein
MGSSTHLAQLRQRWLSEGRPPIVSADGCALGEYSVNVVRKMQEVLAGATPAHAMVLPHVTYRDLDDQHQSVLQAAMTVATRPET